MELYNKLDKIYNNFFDELNIDKKTGIIVVNNRASTYPLIKY